MWTASFKFIVEYTAHQRAHCTTMSFSQSRDFSVGAYTYTHVSGDAYNYNLPPTAGPLKILRNASAVEATHASRTASYAPKCRPGSRARITQDIMDWIRVDDVGGEQAPGHVSTTILWFQGPAGGGKTCIMREVVSLCEGLGYTVVSYFFSTRIPGLDKEEPFVATLAYQLAAGNFRLQRRILQAMSSVPNIFDQSLERQAHFLLVEPLSSDSSRGKIAVVLDGLDECRGPQWQKKGVRLHLISILHTLAISIPNLRIIVASRPEFDIRTAFASPRYAPLTRTVRLQDYDGTSEIRDYLCDEFCRIRETHPAKDSIDPAWPTESTLHILVEKSSGSYIYPSTVIKHISNHRRNPAALLEEVMALRNSKSGSNPLAELHGLYHHILHPPEVDIPVLRRILHCIMTLIEVRSQLPEELRRSEHFTVRFTPEFLDEFLSLAPGTTAITLSDLHSLISVPSKDDGQAQLQFHHKSLEDYITNERSRELHQSSFQSHADTVLACTSHLTSWAEVLSTPNNTIVMPSPVIVYSLGMWTYHLQMLHLIMRSAVGGISLPAIDNFDPTILWKLNLAYRYHRWPLDDVQFFRMDYIARELHSVVRRTYPLCTTYRD